MEEESISVGEWHIKLVIGDPWISNDYTCEEKKLFGESMYDHNFVPFFLHEECMASYRETFECNGNKVPTIENTSKNLVCDNPCTLDEFEQRALTLKYFKDKLLVIEENIMEIITKEDDSHEYI